MNFLDIVFGILLVWGLWRGLKNGLLIEIASIIALILGIYGAIHFSYYIGDYLSIRFDWEARYINILAFVLTFILIVFAVHLIGKLLTKVADIALLGLLNKVAGGIFGALKVAVILGAILVFFERANTSLGLVPNHMVESSVLYGPIHDMGALVFDRVLREAPIEEPPHSQESLHI